MSTSLWGNIGEIAPIRTPVSILREQANILAQATKGLLTGSVGIHSNSGNLFRFDLDIVAPVLNDYRYTLLRIQHLIELYPVTIFDLANDRRFECATEEDFLDVLKDILTSDKTRRIITSLLAQSKA